MYRELGVEPIIDDSGQISHIQVRILYINNNNNDNTTISNT
jgi:hypothetical protein